MLFYLDKILAKQGIAKCIAVSEKEISEKELKERKVCFNVQEVLKFEGIDIPHKFRYNKELDTIEEIIEVEEIQPRILAEQTQEKESDFDESVEIDPEKQYFYLDKEYADKYHKSQIIAVFQQPLKNPTEYFQKEVYSHFGKDIPYYISIDPENVIREATEYEKYTRNQRALQENEVIFKNDIISLMEGQYIDENKQEVVTIPYPSYMVRCVFNQETHEWIETATKNEQLEYLKQEILKNTKELSIYKEAGFSNDELQAKIDELVQKHRILSEEIAMSYIKEKNYV